MLLMFACRLLAGHRQNFTDIKPETAILTMGFLMPCSYILLFY